jgi:AcrR family transcriptional regulator
VYSVYDSKEGLLVALGARAFDTLSAGVAALPTTDHPAADLVEAGVTVFRQFAIQHPWLFRIAIQHALPSAQLAGGFSGAAAEAFAGLIGRVSRLGEAGLLGPHTTEQAACAFHALCEGLAAMELRGSMPLAAGERVWRDALGALVAGFAVPPSGAFSGVE